MPRKKLSICGLSLKKMQKSPFQNHFQPTESSQSPDESSHSLEYPLKNGSVRYKKALLSPSGLMSLLKKKTSTYHKFSRKRSRKKCTSNNHHTKKRHVSYCPTAFSGTAVSVLTFVPFFIFLCAYELFRPRRKLNNKSPHSRDFSRGWIH